MKKSVRLIFFITLLLAACCQSVSAAERITSFVSRVYVQQNGELVVEETISVIAQGDRIRRGIYRDFPTSYTDAGGNRYQVGFSVAGVERDSREEAFHTAKIGNGVRVYMGSKDVTLAAGPHTYTLRYTTNRQLGFFTDHDELYWNVTGNGWSFPIDRARVTITIPESGHIEDYQWYTGATGERSTNAVLTDRGRNFITMETTASLGPGSGFTVVAAWQKGVVKEAGRGQHLLWFVRDHPLFIGGSLSLLVLLLYYYLSWQKVGRDPQSGPVIPLFTPPENISPAAGRYIMNMGFDQKAFAAMLVNMAVKGVLKIERGDDDAYTLHLVSHEVERLTPGERAVRKQLFKKNKTIELKPDNNAEIRAAISALDKSLQRDLLNIYFKNNRAKLALGVALSLVVLLFVALSGKDFKTTAFITVWLLGWSGGTMLLFLQMVRGWRLVKVSGLTAGSLKKALGSTVFFLPFLAGFVIGIGILCTQLSRSGLVLLLLTLFLNFLFAWLLKAPTLPGRRIMDELEGLRMYLSVAEKDRLNILNPPEKTPELFEKLLPWALALDVEQQWGEQFAQILDQAGKEQQYQPAWYSSGSGFSGNGFSSSLAGGLASSISSSSVAPGSSSGFSSGGGGGFSGGGGGGGGGGGW